MFDLQGGFEREWNLDANIQHVSVIGGPSGKESLIIGLKNGSVVKLFVDNPFPIQIVKLAAGVKWLDMNQRYAKNRIVQLCIY